MNVIPLYRGRVKQHRVLTPEQLLFVEATIARRLREVAITTRDTAPTRVTFDLEAAIGETIEAVLYETCGVNAPDLQPKQFDALYWSAVASYSDARRELMRRGVA